MVLPEQVIHWVSSSCSSQNAFQCRDFTWQLWQAPESARISPGTRENSMLIVGFRWSLGLDDYWVFESFLFFDVFCFNNAPDASCFPCGGEARIESPYTTWWQMLGVSHWLASQASLLLYVVVETKFVAQNRISIQKKHGSTLMSMTKNNADANTSGDSTAGTAGTTNDSDHSGQ